MQICLEVGAHKTVTAHFESSHVKMHKNHTESTLERLL